MSFRKIATLFGLCLMVLLLTPMHAAAEGDRPTTDTRPQPPTTDRWVVQFAPGADPDTVAQQVGAENLGRIGRLDWFEFALPGSADRPAVAMQALSSHPNITTFEQVTVLPVETMDPSDPLYPNQWHLNNTGQGDAVAGNDANILPAWNAGYTGAGVDIGIVENNFQTTHPDLAPKYDAARSLFGPTVNPSDYWHATSAAGVAAAADDGTACGVGSAYNANLATLTWAELDGGTPVITDAAIAAAWTTHYDVTDVYNNSWGFTGPAQPIGTVLESALAGGVTNGRGGLGAIYVLAAGNGRSEKAWNDGNPYNEDDTNDSSLAASRYVITVAATSADGDYSGYSSPGASILINAPSNGNSGGGFEGITTTDVTGSNGYDASDCTSTYGGTSSATPLVTGIVALMLEANPDLTWRDVQHILVETAVQTDVSYGGWATNGAGYTVSHDYGHGRVDAGAAVALAKVWGGVAPEQTYTSAVRSVNQAIPDGVSKGSPGTPVTSTINVPSTMRIEHVEIVVNATHTWRGDLSFKLTSPAGTESTMLRFRDFDSEDVYGDWRLNSTHFWGEDATGIWTLDVEDNWDFGTGTMVDWQIIIYGTLDDNPRASYNSAEHTGNVMWDDYNSGETGYRLERTKDGANNWQVLGTVDGNTTSFVDTTATCEQTYVYRVVATAGGDLATWTSDPVPTSCNDFADVPTDLPAPFMEPWVEDFFKAEITGGKGTCTEPGITPGPDDAVYCPADRVTRGEMAVFILRAMEHTNLPYNPPGDPTNPFVDVFPGSPDLPAPFMEDWIEEFYDRGITGGKGTCVNTSPGAGLTYCPKDLVTRAEMAVFILKALNVTPVDDLSDPFVDVPIDLPAPFMEPYVETFLEQGITGGKPNCELTITVGSPTFCPKDNVTRGEMAVFILRAFDQIPNPDSP